MDVQTTPLFTLLDKDNVINCNYLFIKLENTRSNLILLLATEYTFIYRLVFTVNNIQIVHKKKKEFKSCE